MNMDHRSEKKKVGYDLILLFSPSPPPFALPLPFLYIDKFLHFPLHCPSNKGFVVKFLRTLTI